MVFDGLTMGFRSGQMVETSQAKGGNVGVSRLELPVRSLASTTNVEPFSYRPR